MAMVDGKRDKFKEIQLGYLGNESLSYPSYSEVNWELYLLSFA